MFCRIYSDLHVGASVEQGAVLQNADIVELKIREQGPDLVDAEEMARSVILEPARFEESVVPIAQRFAEHDVRVKIREVDAEEGAARLEDAFDLLDDEWDLIGAVLAKRAAIDDRIEHVISERQRVSVDNRNMLAIKI